METLLIFRPRHWPIVVPIVLVASAIACSSAPVPFVTSTVSGQAEPGPISTGAPGPPAQPAVPLLLPDPTELPLPLEPAEPTETFIVADAVAVSTESIPDSGEPVLLGPPIRYLPLEPPAGRDPITAQGSIEQGTDGDDGSTCTVVFGVDNPSPNRVATVRYDALLAPSVGRAQELFQEYSLISSNNPEITSSGWELFTVCPRADECAEAYFTSISQNATILLHVLRTRNLVIVVWLQAQGADGLPWLSEEMPYYVSLVEGKLPAR